MSSLTLLNLTNGSEYLGAVLSLTLNCILLVLLIFRANPHFGSYKYLMMIYALLELTMSSIGAFTRSCAHSMESAYIVFRQYRGTDRIFAPMFLLSYCNTVFALLLILAIHFIYRYVAVRASHHLHIFQGFKMFLWAFGAYLACSFLTVLKYFYFAENEYASEYLRDDLMRHYNLTIEEIVYNGPFYRGCDGSEECHTPPSVWIVTLLKIALLMLCLFLMISFGYLTYSNLRKEAGVMSEKTLQLQRQLLVALLVQSGIPIVFMYIPIGILFISPILGYSFGPYGNITLICIALYPPLDQIATLYIIGDFRTAIKNLLGFKSVSLGKISSVGTSLTRHTDNI